MNKLFSVGKGFIAPAGLITMALIVVVLVGCAGGAPAKEVTLEDTQALAKSYVTNDPTYTFDGIPESLKLTNTVVEKEPSSWTFTYEFESRQAGYGDRTGKMLAQVITPHKAVITVTQGKIIKAIMDNRWDMTRQTTV